MFKTQIVFIFSRDKRTIAAMLDKMSGDACSEGFGV
jgi:hypothetical protein